MTIKINILKILEKSTQVRSLSEGRRMVTMGSVSIRRRKDETGLLGEPEKITSPDCPIELSTGDVILIGKRRTVVVTNELLKSVPYVSKESIEDVKHWCNNNERL